MEINIQNLDNRLKSVETEVHRIGETVNLVYDVLKGNKIDEEGGMVKKVNKLEQRVHELESRNKAEGWVNKVFWVGVGAVVLKAIESIIKST